MHEQNLNGTKRLYYEDSMMMEFNSTVLSSFSVEDSQIEKFATKYPGAKYAIELAETAFFPEGGGQAGDEGCFYKVTDGDEIGPNALKVFYTVEDDGVIYHLTNEELTPGEKVHGRVDKIIRLDRMRQHTGEHIVSGLVHQRFGFDNVGFHLGSDATTLDFDGQLSASQIKEIELLSNEAVFANIPVTAKLYANEEARKIDYRSKLDIEGQVRLVEILDVDLCACCAPHLKTTGEVGLIKIIDEANYKGGTRLTILCGNRALASYGYDEEVMKLLSTRLSVPMTEVKESVELALDESEKRRTEILKWQEKYILASSINEENIGGKIIIRFEEEVDTDIARKYVNAKLGSNAQSAGIFIGSDEGGYRYILGSEEIDLRAFSKDINETLCGKGGGKPEMIQGSLSATREKIIDFFKRL